VTLRLPRLQRLAAITDRDGTPSRAFHQWFDTYGKNIEDAFNQLDAAVAAIAAAQAAADAANAAAAAADAAAIAAQSAADTAQNAADDAAATAAIANSGVTGVTITATDAGTNATISVSGHTRVYGDGTTVSVNSGSVTALAYSTLYYIYYDQASRAGGAVTYQATTSQTTAAQTGNRHLVGSVTTPAAAGAPNDGDYVGPPGVGGIIQ
jgi:hypothetical protein